MGRTTYLKMVVLWACLFFVFSACQVKKAGTTEETPPSITALNSALALPTMTGVGGREEIEALFGDSRSPSRGACHFKNDMNRVFEALQSLRLVMCVFGTIEDGGIIEVPKTIDTPNYYSFTNEGITYSLRTQLYGEGYRWLSFREGETEKAQLWLSKYEWQGKQYWYVNVWSFQPVSDSGVGDYLYFGLGIGTLPDTATNYLKFNYGYLYSGAYNNSDYHWNHFYLAAAEGSNPNYMSAYTYNSTNGIRHLYSQWSSSYGSTKFYSADTNGSNAATITDHWNNDSGATCVSSSSSPFASTVTSYSFTAPTKVTPAAKEASSAPPSGTTATALLSKIPLTLLPTVVGCFTTYNKNKIVAQVTTCNSNSACSRE